MPKAKWQNTKTKKIITGSWEYYRPSDIFTIWLDSVDKITGLRRRLTTRNDKPEWGNWKLLKES